MLEVQLLWSKKFNYIASAFRIANFLKNEVPVLGLCKFKNIV